MTNTYLELYLYISEAGIIIILILQLRKLRTREIIWISLSPQLVTDRKEIKNQAVCFRPLM